MKEKTRSFQMLVSGCRHCSLLLIKNGDVKVQRKEL